VETLPHLFQQPADLISSFQPPSVCVPPSECDKFAACSVRQLLTKVSAERRRVPTIADSRLLLEDVRSPRGDRRER
jgi:hypothetical protein